jgi:hypothetical protein
MRLTTKQGRAMWPFKKKEKKKKKPCEAPIRLTYKKEERRHLSIRPERLRGKRGEFFFFFCRKITIHEDSMVRSSIRLRKLDPCTRIYVSTDHFEVKHLNSCS